MSTSTESRELATPNIDPGTAASAPSAPATSASNPTDTSTPIVAAVPDQDIQPGIVQAIRESQDCADAIAFNDTFALSKEAEYGWAIKHVREQYALADSWFKAADEKAGAMIGYLGSAAGLLAIGSGAAVTSGQLNRWTALAGVPSFVLAALAVICAALVRRPYVTCTPPSGREAAKRANYYLTSDVAEGSLLGQWQLSVALMFWTVGKKSYWLRLGTWAFVSAVVGMILPLIVGISLGSMK